jgi:GTP pyrophosphokinase
VQIRTREMDLIAEEGIAAHWRYKEGKMRPGGPGDPNILWLRQLLEWQQEVKDARTFLTTLKIDLYPDEVYAFTPKGQVMSFPRGATPLDLAYKVHTELGHHCSGARINGKLMPIRTPLNNGDIVEILTNPNRSPSRDWLNFVVTSRAKSKIRHWLNTVQKKRAMEIGRPLLEKELRKYRGVSLKKVCESEAMERYLEDEGLSNLDELFNRVGFGKIAPRQVVMRVLDIEKMEPATEPGGLRKAVSKILPFGGPGPVRVRGHGDLLAYLAKCCNPVPGEEIVGYVTRGKGVSVHSVDCPNVKKLLYNPDREIEVKWAKGEAASYRVTLTIRATDEPGMLAKLAERIAKLESNITQLEADTTQDTGVGLIDVMVQVRNRRHLEKILQGLRSIAGVLDVERKRDAATQVPN